MFHRRLQVIEKACTKFSLRPDKFGHSTWVQNKRRSRSNTIRIVLYMGINKRLMKTLQNQLPRIRVLCAPSAQWCKNLDILDLSATEQIPILQTSSMTLCGVARGSLSRKGKEMKTILYSSGCVVFTRRWRLEIFSLARVTQGGSSFCD
jgi:hypothetical protein